MNKYHLQLNLYIIYMKQMKYQIPGLIYKSYKLNLIINYIIQQISKLNLSHIYCKVYKKLNFEIKNLKKNHTPCEDPKGGDGVVFRDHDRAFPGAACHFTRTMISPEASELMACRRTSLLAAELDIQKLHLKTDCRSVAATLNDQQKSVGTCGRGRGD